MSAPQTVEQTEEQTEEQTVDPVLVVDDVRLTFGSVTAVDGVSFDVRPDELFALIGPNGAGKTSVFNILSGVYRPQQGSVKLHGHELVGMRPPAIARLGMARTFQNIELFANLTVLDNLMLGRHQHIGYGPLAALAWVGKARREELAHRARVEEIVDFLELTAWRTLPVGLLPYGVQKRVELGRALAMDPRLLLLDEPVAGMNQEETEDMARFIVDIRSELKVPMIIVVLTSIRYHCSTLNHRPNLKLVCSRSAKIRLPPSTPPSWVLKRAAIPTTKKRYRPEVPMLSSSMVARSHTRLPRSGTRPMG